MNRPVSAFGIVLALALASSPRALAHEGHDKAPGEGGEGPTTGPISITAEAKKNLALKVEEAELRSLQKTLLVIGQIEVIPNLSGAVSSRIAGRVTDLKVFDGQTVAKGDAVIEVESRQLGDPPPRVQLTSSRSGIVMDRHIVVGDSVEPNQHLLEIADLSQVYAEGHLFEGQVASVRQGQAVRVMVESFPDETFAGKVEVLSGSLDPQTRTLKVWVRIENPELKLRPKMRAQLNIVVAEADTAVTVPHSAVLGEAGHFFVFVQSDLDELAYERKAVVLGMKDDRFYEVIEGVFPSDKVVTDGNYQLQYVTTRKSGASAAGDPKASNPNAVVQAENAPHSHGEAGGHYHPLALPLRAMGITLGVLLVLNLLVMLLRRPKPVVAANLPEAVARPANPAAHDVPKEAVSK